MAQLNIYEERLELNPSDVCFGRFWMEWERKWRTLKCSHWKLEVLKMKLIKLRLAENYCCVYEEDYIEWQSANHRRPYAKRTNNFGRSGPECFCVLQGWRMKPPYFPPGPINVVDVPESETGFLTIWPYLQKSDMRSLSCAS